VPSIYQPRRPRASPLWQIIHHGWDDYLIFHPHLHLLAADGLFTPDGRFHCMPVEQRVPAHEIAGRKRLAAYLLRHPFLGGRSLGEDPSLQKITWNATSKTVIYRSKRHHTTKRNFEVFKAPDDDPDLNWFNQERDPTGAEPESYDQPVRRSLLTAIAPRATAVGEGVSATWQPKEILLDDGHILVLDH
jgi:hypothetical protein